MLRYRGGKYLAAGAAFAKRNLSVVLVIFGLLLLSYVGTQYGQMLWTQHRLEQQWEAQQQSVTLPPSETPDRSDSDNSSVVHDSLTRLTIPKIDFSAVVVEGTDNKALLAGPGHLVDTPAPGDIGNSVISGHRDTFFRHIHELSKGDEVLVQRNGKIFKYEVTEKKIVQPTDLSVLAQSKDKRLTLITCYPTYYIGPAPERLIVTGKLLDDSKASENAIVRSAGMTKSQ